MTSDDSKASNDQKNITTGGGDYAEDNIDKRQAEVFVGGKVYGNVIGKQIVQPPLAPALHQLRAPVSDFVGREHEIDQLVQALSKANGAAAAISGVRGMGGIGKTELAYVAAYRLTAQFPDAQIVVELRGASNPIPPEQALQTIIRAFEREVKLPEDLSQLQGIYRSVLNGKRALILADDAKDVTQVRALMPPLGCGLLVTSRNRFSLSGMVALDLGTLPLQEAEKLLMEVYPQIGEQAGELAKLCGYLPLALRVSASVLKENDSRDVASYLEQLRAERLKHLSDPDNPDDPQASVEDSLRLSYDTLEPMAQSALCQMSVFAGSFEAAAAKAVIVIESEVLGVLELLCRRNLLEWDARATRYGLHDLVREFGATRLTEAEAVRLRHAHYYAHIVQRADTSYKQGGEAMLGGLRLFDKERVEIDAGWRWAQQRQGELVADELVLAYMNATALVGDLRYDKQRERIPQLKMAITVAQQLTRQDMRGKYLGNLGNAYAELGQEDQ